MWGKKKGVDPQQIQTKIRVMIAQIKQPLSKDQTNVESGFRLMSTAIMRKLKDEVRKNAMVVVKARRRVAGFERIKQALTSINDNAGDISATCAQNKNAVPDQFHQDFTIVCNVGDVLRITSFNDFRQSICLQLFTKQVVTSLIGQDKLEEVVQKAFFTDAVSDDELLAVYKEFADQCPEGPGPLEAVIGINLSTPQQIQGGSYQTPQYQQNGAAPQQSAGGAPQVYKAIDTLFIPLDIPEFTKDKWSALSQAIYDATAE